MSVIHSKCLNSMVPLSSKAIHVLNGWVCHSHRATSLRLYWPEHLGIQDWNSTFPSMEQGCPLNWEEWQWPPFYSNTLLYTHGLVKIPLCFSAYQWTPWLPAGHSLHSLSGLVRPNKWKQNQDQSRTCFCILGTTIKVACTELNYMFSAQQQWCWKLVWWSKHLKSPWSHCLSFWATKYS